MFSRKLWIESRSENISLIATILYGTALGGFIIAQAWTLSTLISKVFLDQNTVIELRPQLYGFLLIILGRGLATYGRELSSGAISIKVRTELKRKLINHLQKISPVLVSEERTGEITTTLIQGVDRLDSYFRVYLPQLFLSALVPAMVLWVVFPVDWITGLVMLFTAPLIPLFMVLIGKQAEKETSRQWRVLGRLGGHFLEVIQGLKTLKVFGLSKSQGKVIREVSDQYASITLKVLRIAFLSALVLELLATISTAIIAVQVGIRLMYGQMDLVESLFILILAPEFYFPLRQLGSAYHSGMEGVHAAERIFDILTIPVMAKSVSLAWRKEGSTHKFGEIKFHDVHFSYQEGKRVSLQGISFSIPENKKTAIVGPTGAGKSTILSLILKFLEPDTGSITFSGVDFQKIDNYWIREQISWVPQFPYLFNDTVTANLLIAKPSANLDEIIEAAQKAHLHDEINSLSDGYLTRIGEGGARFSGGQAQRLAIARAFLKDSPLFILDEPTKNLDIQSEELFKKTLDQFNVDKTVLIIAHRLSSVKTADQIVVLDQGKVVKVGKHADLLKVDGLYQKLVHPGGGE